MIVGGHLFFIVASGDERQSVDEREAQAHSCYKVGYWPSSEFLSTFLIGDSIGGLKENMTVSS